MFISFNSVGCEKSKYPPLNLDFKLMTISQWLSIGNMTLDCLSLTETYDGAAENATQDQTERMFKLILLYTL